VLHPHKGAIQVYARPSFDERYYVDIIRKWTIYQFWESHDVLLERSIIITYESTTHKPSNCVPDAPVLNVASQSGNVAGKITPDALARFEQIINMLSEIGLYTSSHEHLGSKPSNRLGSGPQLERESRSRPH
jgi:hypothetical protein